MNSEEDEFRRIEREALRRAAQDDDNTQSYTSKMLLAEAYRCGYEAGAVAEQEPVAWAVQACSKMWRGEFAEIDAKAEAKRIGGTCVAYPLYTTPPQRSWQGLTPDEVKHLYPYGRSVWGRETFEAIEKALKEKNSA